MVSKGILTLTNLDYALRGTFYQNTKHEALPQVKTPWYSTKLNKLFKEVCLYLDTKSTMIYTNNYFS